MTEAQELANFAAGINAEVRERASGIGGAGVPDFLENVFTELICEYLAEIGLIEDATAAYCEFPYGRGSARINAFSFGDGDDTLDLFVTIHVNTVDPAPVAKSDIQRAIGLGQRFLEAAFEGFHSRLEPASESYGVAKRIYEARKSITRVRIFVITDGLFGSRALEASPVEGVEVKAEVWDIERLFRGMQAGLPRDEIEIDLERDFGGAIPCLPMPRAARDYMAYLAILPGEIIFRLYEDFGSRLLELNVRSFLSARGRVNSGIRRTLKDEADRFMAYNNGIVVTVDHLETVTLPDGRPAISKLRGLQIVNGGQTTASIHRAKKVDRADLSTVFVPAKITLIEPSVHEEIVAQVSRCANTQNVIQMADFSANEPFHVEIERLSLRTWCPGQQGRWFYERARGQYQVAKGRLAATPAQIRRFNEQTPPGRKFTKTDLARYEQAWLQRPQVISLGAQKNFDHFMQDLRARVGKEWAPDESYYRDLIAKAIVYRIADRVVRLERFPAYRANIVAYLVAYLCYRTSNGINLALVWQEQRISDDLKELLRRWSHDINNEIIKSSAGRNVTEWCKKEQCWNQIRELSLELPDVLPVEIQGPAPSGGRAVENGERLSHEDLQNMERCRQIDGSTWLEIHAWGIRTGLLQGWQAGIAHTLAGYAASGWSRGPSAKQARQGVKILALAVEHSGLPNLRKDARNDQDRPPEDL